MGSLNQRAAVGKQLSLKQVMGGASGGFRLPLQIMDSRGMLQPPITGAMSAPTADGGAAALLCSEVRFRCSYRQRKIPS